MKKLVLVLFGLWCAFSVLMNAFGFWLSRVWGWNESGSLRWALGFPLMALVGAVCAAYGVMKPRGYMLLVGLIVYACAWVGLAVDRWRLSILVISAVNFIAILFAANALNLFKDLRR